MLKIDADAHVLETETIWESMEGSERKFRPQVVGPRMVDQKMNTGLSTAHCVLNRATWEKIRPWRRENCATPMRVLGVDIQVIFPTIFIIPLTPRPEIELALCRSYKSLDGRYLEAGGRSPPLGRGVTVAQHESSV